MLQELLEVEAKLKVCRVHAEDLATITVLTLPFFSPRIKSTKTSLQDTEHKSELFVSYCSLKEVCNVLFSVVI